MTAAGDLARAERMTALTDLLLALVAGILGMSLLEMGALHTNAWGLVLLTTAAAALAGALFHGTRYRVPRRVSERLWRGTLILSLIVSGALAIAAATMVPSGGVRVGLVALAVVKAVIAYAASRRNGGFAVVAVDSGVSLLVVGGCAIWGLLAGWGGAAGWWILGGVGVSLLGAAVQLRGVRADRTFDHNDLFHLAQMVAAILFFLAARN